MKSKFRLTQNVNLAVVSLGLAFVVWLFAKAGETREAPLEVRVVATGAEEHMEVEITPAEMPVLVRYGQSAYPYISSENFQFEVDTRGMREDLGVGWETRTVSLSEDNWVENVPSAQVNLVKIGHQDSTVEVRLRWKAVPAVVRPDITGAERLPEGYQLVTPVKVTPREIYLVGDAELLQTMPVDVMTSRMEVKTAPISVAGLTEGALETVEILLPPGVRMVQRISSLAEVNLEIQEVQTVREVRGIPLNFEAVAPDTVALEHEAAEAAVRVFGPQSVIKQLAPDSFRISLVRPPEEVPGAARELPLEAHFAASVSDEVRNRVTIQAVEPSRIEVQYLAREAAAPQSGTVPLNN